MKKTVLVMVSLFSMVHCTSAYVPIAGLTGFVLNVDTKNVCIKRNIVGLAAVDTLYSLPIVVVSGFGTVMSVLTANPPGAIICTFVGGTGAVFVSTYASAEYLLGVLLARGVYHIVRLCKKNPDADACAQE